MIDGPRMIELNTQQIIKLRGPKNDVDVTRPYAFLPESECMANGAIESFSTVFLTNRECAFRCLMCDLWKNTTDERVPVGAIPQQIAHAFAELPTANNLKLYNSGNFFDAQAIPPEDYPAIAKLAETFGTVVVENHPKLTGRRCRDFQRLISGQLEVALGLETAHSEALARLNKQMTLADFARAVEFLLATGISVRAFILLQPPGIGETEVVDWALRSVEYAFSLGVSCCSIIPLRGGNGAIDWLIEQGLARIPRLTAMEQVLEQGFELKPGRVFVDLWDAQRFADCQFCSVERISRLQQMNLMQRTLPPVKCEMCRAHEAN